MELIDINIGDYESHPENPNTHPAKQLSELGDSLEQFDQFKNVVIWNNYYLAGHGLVEAAKAKGLTTLKAVDMSHLTEDRAKALMIADNQLPDLSVMDNERLAELLEGFDDPTSVPGVDLAFLDSLNIELPEPPPAPEPEIDKAAELASEYGVEVGQIWRLGEHRLACGDCTDSEVVEAVMDGAKADISVTSPPYGVGKDYETNNTNDWLGLMKGFIRVLPTSVLWVNLANKRTGNNGFERNTFFELCQIIKKYQYDMIGLRIWAKDPTWAGQNPYWRNTYKPVDDFEFIGLFSKEKPKHKTRLTNSENNDWGYRGVWGFGSVSKNKLHSAAYPVDLPSRCIKLTTDPNDIVFDPFSGSGTTIIACEQLKRKCRAIELDPGYVAVSIRRWETLTGEKAELLNE